MCYTTSKHQTVVTMQKNKHTSPKTAPERPPPQTTTTHPATVQSHARFTTLFKKKMSGIMQTSIKFCARGYSDDQVGVKSAKLTTYKRRGRRRLAVRLDQGTEGRTKRGDDGPGRGWEAPAKTSGQPPVLPGRSRPPATAREEEV